VTGDTAAAILRTLAGDGTADARCLRQAAGILQRRAGRPAFPLRFVARVLNNVADRIERSP
jgi:hypothetical protein